METNSRAGSSRRNGAKSQGPITPEGKARSSSNALKHGLASNNILLMDGEPVNQLQTFLRGAMDLFRPEGDFEESLVEILCSSLWRLRRVMDFETAILDAQLATIGPELEASFELIDSRTRKALAFKALADESLSLQLILRYEGRASRTFQQTSELSANSNRSAAAAKPRKFPNLPLLRKYQTNPRLP